MGGCDWVPHPTWHQAHAHWSARATRALTPATSRTHWSAFLRSNPSRTATANVVQRIKARPHWQGAPGLRCSVLQSAAVPRKGPLTTLPPTRPTPVLANVLVPRPLAPCALSGPVSG